MDKHYTALFICLLIIFVDRFFLADFFGVVVKTTFLFFLLPAFFVVAVGGRLNEIGFGLGKLKLGLVYSAVALLVASPMMYAGSQMPDFRSYYPIWQPARESLGGFVLYELLFAVLLFSNEFFFRGFLLFNLVGKLGGRWRAIVLHSLVYALLHLGKPFLEVPYSFFAGLVFGYVALRCRSILPSFIMHYVGNIVFDSLIVFT